jgi:outer membrane protein
MEDPEYKKLGFKCGIEIHQQLEATWAAWKNSEAYLRATRDQVKNAEAALEGLREELKYGQRTTWDILYYQQTLVNARVAFVTAQRDRIITSYNVMAAIGILSANTLDIDVPKYEVTDHYDRVKNQFIGLEPWK